MAERQASIVIDLRFAWWLRPYLAGVTFVATVMGAEPDWGKVERVVRRAIKMRVRNG